MELNMEQRKKLRKPLKLIRARIVYECNHPVTAVDIGGKGIRDLNHEIWIDMPII